MTDILSKSERSLLMSKIKSKNTKPEKLLCHILKKLGLKVFKHPKMCGSPDFFIRDLGIVVFLDGCFWHGCKKDLRLPKSNAKYWLFKINKNIIRDRKINNMLKKKGYKVVRFWEHELKY